MDPTRQRSASDYPRERLPLKINPPDGMPIEEYLTGGTAAEYLNPIEVAKLGEITPIARIVVNLCLFAVERGLRILPQDPRAEKRRRRARAEAGGPGSPPETPKKS